MIFGTDARRKTAATRRLADHSSRSQRLEDRCLIRWEIRHHSRLESHPQRGGFFAIPVPEETAPIARRRRMSCWSNRRAVAVQAGAGRRVRSRTRFESNLETRRRPVGALHRSRPANAHREQELDRREPWPAPAQGKRDRHPQREPLRRAIGNDPQSMESQRARQVEPKCREKAQEGRFQPRTPPPAKNAGRIPIDSEVLRIEGTSFKRIRRRGFGGNSHGMSTPAGSKRVHSTRKATNPFLHRCAKKGL